MRFGSGEPGPRGGRDSEIERVNSAVLQRLHELVRQHFETTPLEGHALFVNHLPAQLAELERQATSQYNHNLGGDEFDHALFVVRQQIQTSRLSSVAHELWRVVADGRYEQHPGHYDMLAHEGFAADNAQAAMAIDQLLASLDEFIEAGVGIAAETARHIVANFAQAWPQVMSQGSMLAPVAYRAEALRHRSKAVRDILRNPDSGFGILTRQMLSRVATLGPPATAAAAVGAISAQPAAAAASFVIQAETPPPVASNIAGDLVVPVAPTHEVAITDTAIIALGNGAYEADVSAPSFTVGVDAGLTLDVERPPAPYVPPVAKRQRPHNASTSPEVSSGRLQKQAIEGMKKRGGKWVNRAIAFEFFLDKGLTPQQSAAIAGNLIHEAGNGSINPKSDQAGFSGPLEGMGIAQWTKNARWQDLIDFAKENPRVPDDPFNLTTQLEFIWHEMNHVSPWKETMHQLKKSPKSVKRSTQVFMDFYEKPGIKHFDSRLKWSKRVMKAYDEEKQQLTSARKRPVQTKGVKIARVMETKPGQINYAYGINPRQYRKSEATPKSPRTPIKKALERRGYRNGHLENVTVRVGDKWGSARMHPQAAVAYRAMSDAFEARFGEPLQFNGNISDYRSYHDQVKTFRNSRPGFAARPGHSNHGLGLAADVNVGGFESQRYQWMKENAIRFGFAHPYALRKGSRTPEPWHWEYVAQLHPKYVR